MRSGTALLVIDDPGRGSGGDPPPHDPPAQPDVVRQVVELLREAALLHERDGRLGLAASHRRRATGLEQHRREPLHW